MAMSLGTKVIRHVPSMDWFKGKPLLDFTKLRGGSIVYFPIIEFCPILGSKVNPQYISITDGYIILSMYYHVVSPLNPTTFGPLKTTRYHTGWVFVGPPPPRHLQLLRSHQTQYSVATPALSWLSGDIMGIIYPLVI